MTKHPKRWKGMDTVIFEPDIIEYAFVGVYLSDVKVMGEIIQMNYAKRFTNTTSNYYVCAIIKRPKKHVFNDLLLKWLELLLLGEARQRQSV